LVVQLGVDGIERIPELLLGEITGRRFRLGQADILERGEDARKQDDPYLLFCLLTEVCDAALQGLCLMPKIAGSIQLIRQFRVLYLVFGGLRGHFDAG
jgi:hypothetical protein